jgi:hypothetical protein
VTDHNHAARKRWRLMHIIWAVLAGSICVVLVFARGGHPPPIVLLPVVLAVWAAVHLALWASRLLLSRGNDRAAAAQGEVRSWPPGLLLLAVATAVATLVGLLQLVVSIMLGRLWPFAGLLWSGMAAVWAAHALCLAGLLLRRHWARWTAALLCIGWALALAAQVLEPALLGYPEPLALALAGGVVICLGLAAYWLLHSSRVATFLAQ